MTHQAPRASKREIVTTGAGRIKVSLSLNFGECEVGMTDDAIAGNPVSETGKAGGTSARKPSSFYDADPDLVRRATIRMIAIVCLGEIVIDLYMLWVCVSGYLHFADLATRQDRWDRVQELGTVANQYAIVAALALLLAGSRAVLGVGLWRLKSWARAGMLTLNFTMILAICLSVINHLSRMVPSFRDHEAPSLTSIAAVISLATLGMSMPLISPRASTLFRGGYTPKGSPPGVRRRWPAAALLIMGSALIVFRDLIVYSEIGTSFVEDYFGRR